MRSPAARCRQRVAVSAYVSEVAPHVTATRSAATVAARRIGHIIVVTSSTPSRPRSAGEANRSAAVGGGPSVSAGSTCA